MRFSINFLTYNIKHYVEIEKNNINNFKNMINYKKFESVCTKNLIRSQKLQFFKFFVFEFYSNIYNLDIIMFV